VHSDGKTPVTTIFGSGPFWTIKLNNKIKETKNNNESKIVKNKL